jgi:arginyl-tRNA synthetase
MNLLIRLQRLFHAALRDIVADPAPYAAMVRPAQDARFGDYQANCAMSLAKQLGPNVRARDVAERIAKALDLGDMLGPPEVAGPGFINLRLRNDWLAAQLQHMAADERLGVEPAQPPRTFVIDYSSPNVAKPMHVGHLRSTIIGDALARLLRFLGHKVTSDNHLGDWGTQFGMILWGWKHHRDEQAYAADPVGELARLYRLVQTRISRGDEEGRGVEEAARAETAKLHAGDPENRRLWGEFIPHCLAAIQAMYDRLDIHFDVQLGESFYDPMLPDVVAALQDRGLAVESRGALCVFVEGKDAPVIVRKSDGAFTYSTSDLATVKYRKEHFNPSTVLYVVDHRQGDHFLPMFDVARRWGFGDMELLHVAFGTIKGRDGKPYKTREGDVVGLESLLDEAVARARKVVDENSPELDPAARQGVAEIVGLGAVKYADLCQNRTSDYVFDWDKMLAMDGNTATYMQYAYVRNRGIFRKGDVDVDQFRSAPPPVVLEAPEERALGVQLLRFQEALDAAAAEYKPNFITAYLWDLAKAYSVFFVNCPVLKAPAPALRQSRLLLCDLTARVIQRGLDLLGIRTVERM